MQPRHPASPSRMPSAVLRFVTALLLGIALGGLAGGALLAHRLWRELPPVDHLADYAPKLPLRIHARDGTLLAEFGAERRELVPIDEIPPHLRQALLAIEDSGFYGHRGVDYGGLLRAAWSNIAAGGKQQGGSTITMQVARLFFLSTEKTYRRKILEVLLAYKLERAYGKDKLLELYMNQAYLGRRAYGFAAAASVYFDKPLAELTLAEAAMLAGLPKAPSAYNPVANRERAVQRQRHILARMRALGWIGHAAYQEAQAEPLVLRAEPEGGEFAAGHPVEQARKWVVDHFGEEAYTRGLDVTLSIDVAHQRAAMAVLREGLLRAQDQRGWAGPEARLPLPLPDGRAALRRALAPYADSGTLEVALVREASAAGIEAVLRDGTAMTLVRAELPGWALHAHAGPRGRLRIEAGMVIRVERQGARWRLRQLPRMEGALVALDAGSGEILALAGGFDARLGQFDHAVQALRQPGSTFKPFVYSAALEQGFFPGSLLADMQRVVKPAARGRKAWAPRNYGHQYEGVTSARRALVRSKNVATVNLMEAVGPLQVRDFAARFGFDPRLNPAELPLALGAGAISPLGLASAYGVFAQGGERVAPRLVMRVAERGGPVIYQAGEPLRERAIPRRNAYVMDSLLRDAVREGTGRGALAIRREDVAGKTGTSNDARDVWFAGYSSGLAAVAWMGYDQPRSLGRATGGTLALPMWTQYMKGAVAGRAPVQRPMPDDLVLFGGDFVYPEYLDRPCTDDGHPHVQAPFECPG